MAIVVIAEASSRESYESVEPHLNLAGDRPHGLIVHTASETPTGTVRTVSVWETQADVQAFEQGRLFPAFDAAGVRAETKAAPRPTYLETFRYVC